MCTIILLSVFGVAMTLAWHALKPNEDEPEVKIEPSRAKYYESERKTF